MGQVKLEPPIWGFPKLGGTSNSLILGFSSMSQPAIGVTPYQVASELEKLRRGQSEAQLARSEAQVARAEVIKQEGHGPWGELWMMFFC